jgi:hypothetical protein
MPGNGPKYRPWSTATTTAFFPSENNLDKRMDSPVTGMAHSFCEKIIPDWSIPVEVPCQARKNNYGDPGFQPLLFAQHDLMVTNEDHSLTVIT